MVGRRGHRFEIVTEKLTVVEHQIALGRESKKGGRGVTGGRDVAAPPLPPPSSLTFPILS
jgi:hypothetical protein